jgi:hypothetical protein
MACSYPKATIREEVHCCHAKFTGDWEKKKCAVPSFFQPVTLRVANCLICACVSARESSAKPNPPNNSFKGAIPDHFINKHRFHLVLVFAICEAYRA